MKMLLLHKKCHQEILALHIIWNQNFFFFVFFFRWILHLNVEFAMMWTPLRTWYPLVNVQAACNMFITLAWKPLEAWTKDSGNINRCEVCNTCYVFERKRASEKGNYFKILFKLFNQFIWGFILKKFSFYCLE